MTMSEKLICTVELCTKTLAGGGTDTKLVLIEASGIEDAKVQACRLALRSRREAVSQDRALWSVRLWETPVHRVDVDGSLHRGSHDKLVLEWTLNTDTTLDRVLEDAEDKVTVAL